MRKKVTIKETIQNKRDKNESNDGSSHPVWKENQGSKIPRAFRWTLESKTYPNIHWWVKNVKTDYKNKMLGINVYDDKEGEVFKWIQLIITSENKDELNLYHLDANEKPMYLVSFKELSVVNHQTEYDYKSSDVLTNQLIVSFKQMERINDLDIN